MVKLLVFLARGLGFNPRSRRLAITISEIGYLLPQSREVTEKS